MRAARAGAAAVALALCGAAGPQGVTIAGPGGVQRTEDAAALARLAPVLAASLRAKDGREIGYSGPSLFEVLQAAGVVAPDMRVRSHETVTVTGSDGYAAVLALAELDPGFEGKAVELATAADGKKLDRPRLVVPGDKAKSRDVRDVVSIVVR